MKVGTDGVLLGITANTENVKKILDVGTGCGLIALMLAQKCSAEIHTIDIDHDSCKQAHENFLLSPWKNRMHIIEDDFIDFSENTSQTYDLIVSNPPFFETGDRKPQLQKSRARHCDWLNFDNLCKGASSLLNPHGKFLVILPENRILDFLVKADFHDLHLKTALLIHPVIHKVPNRFIFEFVCAHPQSQVYFSRLFVRKQDGLYTKEFKDYVKEYYLDFAY